MVGLSLICWHAISLIFWSPFSVGELVERLFKLTLRLCAFGVIGGSLVLMMMGCVGSSGGKHNAIIASKQFTNNSDDSPCKLCYKYKEKIKREIKIIQNEIDKNMGSQDLQ